MASSSNDPTPGMLLSGKDRLRKFTLGVPNRLLPITQSKRKFDDPLDHRIARKGGPYKERRLRFPEFLELLKKEEASQGKDADGEITMTRTNRITSLPLELIYAILEYLCCEDLAQLCLVSREVNKITTPLLYNTYTPIADIRYMRTEVMTSQLENPNISLWKDWSLWLAYYHRSGEAEDWDPTEEILEHLTKVKSLERLTFKVGYEVEHTAEYMEKFFARKFEKNIAERVAPKIFPKLTSLLYFPNDPAYIGNILQHCTNLTSLVLICNNGGPYAVQTIVEKYKKWGSLLPTIAKTVGKKLKYLTVDHRIHNPDTYAKFIQPLTSKEMFPMLEIVTLIGNRWEERNAEVDQYFARYMPILFQTCKASIAHGGWKIDKLQHVLNLQQFATFNDPKDVKTLVDWLEGCPWPKLPYGERLNWQLKEDRLKWPSFMDCPTVGIEEIWDGFVTIDKRMMGELDEPLEPEEIQLGPAVGGVGMTGGPMWLPDEEITVIELSTALKKVTKLFESANVPFKLSLRILRPHYDYNPFNIRSRVWQVLPPHLAGLRIHPIPCKDVDTIQDSSDDWMSFFAALFPSFHRMQSFQIKGAGEKLSPIFFPAKHGHLISDLVHNHSLREFDLDFGALLQPGTFCNYTSEDPPQLGSDIQAPRMVMGQVLWISTPFNYPNKMPGNPLMLHYLTSITLRNLFIYREVEMTWVANIPIKLKALEYMRFEGLVWAVGFDPEKDLDMMNPEEEAEEEGNNHNAADGGELVKGGDEKEKGKDKGKGKEIADEADPEPLWFKPKNGDYAKYNLEKEDEEDEELKAQRRRERTRKRNLKRRKKRKAAAAGAADGATNTGGADGAGAASEDDSDYSDSDVDSGKGKSSAAGGGGGGPPQPHSISSSRVVSTIENQLTKFNLGDHSESRNKVPIDDGLLSWLGVDKNLVTPPSSPSIPASSVSDDSSDSRGPTIISSNSTIFGTDPRFAEMTNIRLRIARHKDWFINMLLKGSKMHGGQLREVVVRNMILNGKGQKVYRFNANRGGDFNPYESDWSEQYNDEDFDEEDDFDEDEELDELWQAHTGEGPGGYSYYDGIDDFGDEDDDGGYEDEDGGY